VDNCDIKIIKNCGKLKRKKYLQWVLLNTLNKNFGAYCQMETNRIPDEKAPDKN